VASILDGSLLLERKGKGEIIQDILSLHAIVGDYKDFVYSSNCKVLIYLKSLCYGILLILPPFLFTCRRLVHF
jgi:hypothetical protein